MNDRNLFKLALTVLALPVVIAAGCSDRYRYECHDPNNWNTDRCKKPICELHRDCPELIFNGKSEKVGIPHDQISKPNIQQTQKECNNGK
jgi:hypothetical protein